MLKAVIIEDEKSARNVLRYSVEKYCNQQVTIVGEASTVLKGVELIKKVEPDLVFLDIEMPNHSGLELIGFFESINFEIIFTTAYSQYALKAFELSAIDYLLKPIQIDRLKDAVEKATTKNALNRNSERIKILEGYLKSKEVKKISIPYAGGFHIVVVDEIILVEANRAYCTIHSVSGELFVSKSLAKVYEMLSEIPHFFRSHRSYLINTNHILKLSSDKNNITLTKNLIANLSPEKAKPLRDILKDL